MIKRDKRNIGKLVRIASPGSHFHNRIGKVIGFRGNWEVKPYIPIVSVAIKNLNDGNFGGTQPIPGHRLTRIDIK